MDSQPTRVQVRGPLALLAVVPHLLGFHPERSLVVVAISGPHGRVKVAFRFDLPDPPDTNAATEIADHTAVLLHRNGLTTAVVIGYGPGTLVTPVADTVRVVLAREGVRVQDLLRVDEGRYWSYLCADPACCPADGTAVSDAHPAAVTLTVAGIGAMANRAAVAASIAPVGGPYADAMARATEQAERMLADDLAAKGPDPVRVACVELVRAAIARYRDGETVTDHLQLARIAVALTSLEIRDDAWARMLPEHHDTHIRLWTHLTRHAQPGHIAAPASLLAFTAWQAGDGALANLAIDRALADDHEYSMARLIRTALTEGVPPSAAVLSMTPDEVAASYQAQRHGR
jgi:hypothetical protein